MCTAVEQIDNVAVVVIHGTQLDSSNAPQFQREIDPILKSSSRVVFDLSNLRFVDNSGLGFMLTALEELNSRGGQLKLSGMTKTVRIPFESVRLHRLFDIFPTKEEAIKAF